MPSDGVINILEGILPMDQMNKPILNPPVSSLSLSDSIVCFIVTSLLSVIRQMTKTHLILCL